MVAARSTATKLMGALRPESIMEALQVRDDAAREPFAQCSRLLARMDRMHANAGLGEAEEHYRACVQAAEARTKAGTSLSNLAGEEGRASAVAGCSRLPW